MAKLTNRLGLPQPLVEAVSRWSAKYNRGSADYTATQIQVPALIHRLRRDHRNEIVEDVVDRLYAMQGQVIHHILEEASQDDRLVEYRMTARVGGYTISGQADVYDIDHGVIQDYKTCSVWSVIDSKPEWVAQLNVLAHLARLNGGSVERLQIVALYRDWSRSRALEGGAYPQYQAEVIEIPIWSHADAERYILDRASMLRRAETAPLDEVPQCSPTERWARPSQYAVMREGRKTAIRIYQTRDEAVAHIEKAGDANLYIEERPGVDTRCEYYCDVRAWCPYKQKKEIANGTEQ